MSGIVAGTSIELPLQRVGSLNACRVESGPRWLDSGQSIGDLVLSERYLGDIEKGFIINEQSQLLMMI